ncbi:hypothetical protein QCA50_014339 [Cerrena zonata]|uniref:Glycosyltransferase n=1 Tax=Cerrena zonata TaxID=2478898 RepID=A0AAW0FWG3_9APHY
MSSKPTAHIVFFAVEAWGHTRPLCNLALRLIQERPLYITFFTASSFLKRIEDEISRNFGPENAHLRELIRVVTLKPLDSPLTDPSQFHQYMGFFSENYERLLNEQPVTCFVSGKEITPVIPPEVLVMDFFCTPALEAVRKLSKKPVKVYAWMSAQASFIIYPFAPKQWGGRGDLRPKIAEEIARSGRPLTDVAFEILHEPTGSIINVPGIPPMYDHERFPQKIDVGKVHGFFSMMMHSFLDQCDGVILSTAEPYEAEAISHVTQWFGETSREVFTFGPLLPTGESAAAGEGKQSEKAAEITRFLQKTLETDGPNSLLYISFGSLFWPSDAGKIWAFLDVVMERKLPFILSHASPFCVMPDEIIAKVNAYGKGLLSKWSPQQTILSHPATGWFVSHCGQNSVMEALTLGTPMICWPFGADQPTNAARLSSVLDVAYELFEIRTGELGLKPIHRLGKAPLGTVEAIRNEASSVLEKAFGADGARKRANMKILQEAVSSTWSENGPAQRDLLRLIATLPK